MYDPARWLLPDDPPEPTDSADAVAWAAFEDAHRAAYGRHLAARQVWINEHGQPSIEAALAVPDEPFDPADLWRFNPADL